MGFTSSPGRSKPITRQHCRLDDDVLRALSGRYGLTVVANKPEFVDDPTGDRLDALLCAVQAAWAWRNLTTLLDEVADIDSREGWIADPGGV